MVRADSFLTLLTVVWGVLLILISGFTNLGEFWGLWNSLGLLGFKSGWNFLSHSLCFVDPGSGILYLSSLELIGCVNFPLVFFMASAMI